MADTGFAGPGYEAPPEPARAEARGDAVETRAVVRTWLDGRSLPRVLVTRTAGGLAPSPGAERAHGAAGVNHASAVGLFTGLEILSSGR